MASPMEAFGNAFLQAFFATRERRAEERRYQEQRALQLAPEGPGLDAYRTKAGVGPKAPVTRREWEQELARIREEEEAKAAMGALGAFGEAGKPVVGAPRLDRPPLLSMPTAFSPGVMVPQPNVSPGRSAMDALPDVSARFPAGAVAQALPMALQGERTAYERGREGRQDALREQQAGERTAALFVPQGEATRRFNAARGRPALAPVGKDEYAAWELEERRKRAVDAYTKRTAPTAAPVSDILPPANTSLAGAIPPLLPAAQAQLPVTGTNLARPAPPVTDAELAQMSDGDPDLLRTLAAIRESMAGERGRGRGRAPEPEVEFFNPFTKKTDSGSQDYREDVKRQYVMHLRDIKRAAARQEPAGDEGPVKPLPPAPVIGQGGAAISLPGGPPAMGGAPRPGYAAAPAEMARDLGLPPGTSVSVSQIRLWRKDKQGGGKTSGGTRPTKPETPQKYLESIAEPLAAWRKRTGAKSSDRPPRPIRVGGETWVLKAATTQAQADKLQSMLAGDQKPVKERAAGAEALRDVFGGNAAAFARAAGRQGKPAREIGDAAREALQSGAVKLPDWAEALVTEGAADRKSGWTAAGLRARILREIVPRGAKGMTDTQIEREVKPAIRKLLTPRPRQQSFPAGAVFRKPLV